MWMLLVAFVAAFAVTLAVVRSAKRLEGLAGDHDLSGPQKFHARPVPRIGGVGTLVVMHQVSAGLSTGLLIAITYLGLHGAAFA